jgi:hypothetical protein
MSDSGDPVVMMIRGVDEPGRLIVDCEKGPVVG